jgi:N-acetylmuramoyl-L-alanine amidase
LGHQALNDPPDTYGDETVALVQAFQRARGLVITGQVDELTWTRLDEAGWRLGQRLLYLAQPYLRGDDVAELQVRLAQLGFNPGRIDGIFGPILEDAIREFQRNCAINVDGTLTRNTLSELIRVSPSAPSRNLVTDARDLAGFDADHYGPIIICGSNPLRGLLAQTLEAEHLTIALDDASADEIARIANDKKAVVVLSLAQLETIDGVHLHYWASYRSYSRRGEKLASAIAAQLSKREHSARVELTGMALPVLRETQMTTLHIEFGAHTEIGLADLAQAISSVVLEVIHR